MFIIHHSFIKTLFHSIKEKQLHNESFEWGDTQKAEGLKQVPPDLGLHYSLQTLYYTNKINYDKYNYIIQH